LMLNFSMITFFDVAVFDVTYFSQKCHFNILTKKCLLIAISFYLNIVCQNIVCEQGLIMNIFYSNLNLNVLKQFIMPYIHFSSNSKSIAFSAVFFHKQ
jgi:hypothetical protein